MDYYVYGYIRLNDNSIFKTHFRWSDQEEDAQGKELDDRYLPMEEYYREFILGREIIRIEVGLDDGVFDECYVKAYVTEDDHVRIPLNIMIPG